MNFARTYLSFVDPMHHTDLLSSPFRRRPHSSLACGHRARDRTPVVTAGDIGAVYDVQEGRHEEHATAKVFQIEPFRGFPPPSSRLVAHLVSHSRPRLDRPYTRASLSPMVGNAFLTGIQGMGARLTFAAEVTVTMTVAVAAA